LWFNAQPTSDAVAPDKQRMPVKDKKVKISRAAVRCYLSERALLLN
jgi:hypothetical protein